MILTAARNPTAPIGVFDSGLGGLTVVRRLMDALPLESVVYVADQAHVPYGGRELGEVCGFASGISEALFSFGCKAIVMACNISSATALPCVKGDHPDALVLGVILPGAAAAARQTGSGRIGVMATEGTVKSGAYTRSLRSLNPGLTVTEVACPAFVPLVESGQVETEAALCAVRQYLAPLQDANVDTVVLGCTHYPFLLPLLQRAAPGFTYIDPAEHTVRALAADLSRDGLEASSLPNGHPPRLLLTTTRDAENFARQIHTFLPGVERRFELGDAVWRAGRLHIRAAS